MSVAAAIQTDNSEVEPIVGAENLAITLRRSSNGQAAAPTASALRNSRRLTIFTFLIADGHLPSVAPDKITSQKYAIKMPAVTPINPPNCGIAPLQNRWAKVTYGETTIRTVPAPLQNRQRSPSIVKKPHS